jgi:tetratricopeptide (TPR) repeat protein
VLAALLLFRQLGDLAGEARSHGILAILFDQIHRPRAALNHSSHAMQLYIHLGNRLGQAMSLNDMAWDHIQLGDYQLANDLCEQALALWAKTGGHTVGGNIWDTLGLADHKLGHAVEAIRCYEQAVSEYRHGSHRPGEASALTSLGEVHHSRGDLPATENCWRQALEILTDLQDPDANVVREKLAQLGQR